MVFPVYVINLDRRPDRWIRISGTLDQMGIQYERISAVDARELEYSAAKIQSHVHSSETTRKISIGDEACALSHFKAMESFLNTSHSIALILEDDAILASDLPQLLGSIEWFPRNYDLVNLEVCREIEYLAGPRLGITPTGRMLREIYRFQKGGGTSAYFISRRGASLVMNSGKNFSLQISHLLFDRFFSSVSRTLRPVQVFPAMARQQRIGDSDIAPTADWNKEWKRSQKTIGKRLKRLPFRFKLVILRVQGVAKKIYLNYQQTH